MHLVNYEQLKKDVIGTSVHKPLSGTLSGHAAGEPFDKHVYENLKTKFPDYAFRQYEYLNHLYTKNTDKAGFEARQSLFNSPTVMFLLSRGKNATDKWSIETPFEEKQNDTADMLVTKDGFFDIIDIKTRNLSKQAQSPNIISSFKLAQVCARMIDNDEFDKFTINYFQIDWSLEGDKLVCKEAHFANLFKVNPSELYINWAAAMQVQFHVHSLDQGFSGSMEEWARLYLKHFVASTKNRADYMIVKFAKPFEKYIIN
jgi:type II restriction enzyme